MRFSLTIFLTIIFIGLSTPLLALDFTIDDFDPSPEDPTETADMAEYMAQAVGDLIDELSYIHTDTNGYEVITLTPFPMELVALMTQTNIFEYGSRTEEELTQHVAGANVNKPGPNYFHFLMESNEDWAGRDVTMWYLPETDSTEGIMIPVYRAGPSVMGDGGVVISDFVVVAETPEELQAFLAAAKVKLIVEDVDTSIEAVIVDVGYWRRFGLFDLRVEEIEEDEE